MKRQELAAVAVVIGVSLLALSGAWAQSPPAAQPAGQVAELQIHSGDNIKSVLERLTGREATLIMAGGGELTGTVAKVEAQLVHLSRLRGKDFFDAAVRLDTIGAVTVRVRTR